MKDPDATYIDQVLNGNKDAFGHLVSRHQDMVFSLAVRIANDRGHAEEIAQTVFIKAYQALPRFKKQSRFSTWLYSIAYNTALSEARKYKRQNREMPLEQIPEQYTVGGATENKEQLFFLRKAIDRLKPQDALLVTLYHLDERSVEEVSRQTGLTISNVKVKLYRARKKIYENLRELLQDEPDTIL